MRDNTGEQQSAAERDSARIADSQGSQGGTASRGAAAQERGASRDAHLAAGRELARTESERSRQENEEAPLSADANSEAGVDAQPRGGLSEADIKAAARSRYEGTDEEFEQVWAAEGAKLVRDIQQGIERLRRRL